MRKISLEKIVLNMGVGKSGDVIEIAKKALDQINQALFLLVQFVRYQIARVVTGNHQHDQAH